MTPQDAAKLVNQYADDAEIDQLLIDLLRAPSPQTSLQESDPDLKRFVTDVVQPRLRALTGDGGTIDGMGNLIWRRPGRNADGGLLLMGYAMTFPAGGMKDPFSGKRLDGASFGIAGEVVRGRGACEQKGALAAMTYAAAIVSRANVELNVPLTLAVSLAGETGRHDAAKYMAENTGFAAKYAIVGLGTNNRICLGNKGRIDVEITVRGKSAHSSMPWDGVNAIDGARKVMERLDSLPLGDPHPHLGKGTLTLTQIKSGPEVSHTVPDQCKIILDRRLLPGDDPDRALGEIRNALRSLLPWQVEVAGGAFMYPSEVSAGSRIAGAIRSAGSEISGKSVEDFYSPAALDAGFLNRIGVESIMYGPGDLRFAHTDDEVVSLQDLHGAGRILAAMTLRVLT